jgi:hypothetical protein
MFQIAGGAVGLGISTAIFTSASENELGELARSKVGLTLTGHEQAVLHGDLAGTDSAAAALAELPNSAISDIQEIVRESFANGVQTSFQMIAVVAAIGFLVAVFDHGRTPDPKAPQPEPAEDPAASTHRFGSGPEPALEPE